MAVGILFAFAAALRAQEKTAPAPATTDATPPAARTENSIESAKKDFETIKAARDAALQEKGDVPRLSVPAWQGATPALGASPASKALTPEKKSAHWLLDAMEKPKASDAHGPRGANKPDRELARERTSAETRDRDPNQSGELKGEANARRGDGELTDEEKRKETTAAANPLARYLGEWMTPRDYALLKPGLDQSLATGKDTTRGGAPLSGIGSGAGAPLLPGGDVVSGLLAAGQMAFTAPMPRENPYLQALAAPESAPTMLVAPPKMVSAPPSSSSSVPPLLAAPLLAPPAQSRIPEFAKPATDEKYFKQLKRF